MKRRVYDDDDGRTIADMSDVGTQPMLVPRLLKKRKAEEESAASPENAISKNERRGFVLGALCAALLIGAVFLGVIAAAIALMLTVWK